MCKTEDLDPFWEDLRKRGTGRFGTTLVRGIFRSLSQAHTYPPLTNNGPSRAFGRGSMQLYGGLAPHARQNAGWRKVVALTVS